MVLKTLVLSIDYSDQVITAVNPITTSLKFYSK